MNNLKKYITDITPLSEKSWDDFCNCLTEQEYKKGVSLLKENETCNEIFFINSGWCKSVYNKDGKEINIAFYFENDFATNTQSLINGVKSDYEIRACENMMVIKLNKNKLLKAYEKSHEIEAFGRKLLSQLIAQQEEHANDFKMLTPKQRYEKLLSTQPHLLQKVSLTQLASYLGISRETLSRIRGK